MRLVASTKDPKLFYYVAIRNIMEGEELFGMYYDDSNCSVEEDTEENDSAEEDDDEVTDPSFLSQDT